MILRADAESRPLVGSSRNSTKGFEIISIPIDTLFFYPPLIPFCIGLPIFTFFLLVNINYKKMNLKHINTNR